MRGGESLADLGNLTGVTIADLDRALAAAGAAPEQTEIDYDMKRLSTGNVAQNFRVGQQVEALFSGQDDFYAATILEVKQSMATGEVKYLVRYDEYGNEKLVPESSLRAAEAPPEVNEIAAQDMKYAVGATIEAQYVEDQEVLTNQIHTKDVLFV